MPGYQPRLTQAERRLKNELLDAHRGTGFAPPMASDLVARAGARAEVVPELLDLLAEEGLLATIEPKVLYLDAEADLALHQKVAERLAGGGTMSMADLRDLLGTSRKYAVPIGEYLDRIGLTIRDGDLRRLGTLPGSDDDHEPT